VADVKTVRRALAWSTLNNVAIRVGSLATGILLARILAPEEFGVFAVAMTIQAIVMALADLGMAADIIRHGEQGRAGTVTTMSLATGVLLAGGMCLLAGPLAEAMGSPDAVPVIRVMSLTLLLSGVSVVPYAMMQREFRQSAQMALDGSSLVVSTIVTVGLVALGFGAMSLAISRVVSQALVTVLQFRLTRSVPRFGFDPVIAGPLLRFGLPLAAANVISWVVMNVGHLTIGAATGALMLGFYTMAFNISTWPMSALGMAIRAVALPAFATVDDPRRRADGFVSAASLTWAVALLVGIGLSGLASVVVPLLYGERWSASAQALAGLAVFGALRVLFDLMATFLIAVGASRAVLVVQVVWLVALFPAVWFGVTEWGLHGAGWAQAAVSAAVTLPVYVFLLRRHGVSFTALSGRLLVPLLAAPAAIAAGMLALRLTDQPFLQLVLGGLAITVVFLAPLAWWLRRRLAELQARGGQEVPAPEPALQPTI
jgi:lipopolysaccharide exporter